MKEDIKLSNEERARVFLMYWQQFFIYNGSLHIVRKLIGITNGWDLIDDNTPASEQTFRVDKSRLLLTPLSEITDEHAIEIAKILIPEWRREPDFKPRIFRQTKQLFMNIQGYEMVHIFFDGTLMYKDKDGVDCYTLRALQAYDRLRELGYALPYKGKSLFDLGIAINKNNQ